MSDYSQEADFADITRSYPLAADFLSGPAKLSRDELRALQQRRFTTLMARGWQVEFYRRRWRAAGLEPGDITDLSDLVKLPTFSKSDLMQSIAEHPPFGDFHGVDFSDPQRPNVVLHTTSGTTGAPQPLLFGARDREIQNALLARSYILQGLRADDVAHSVYGFGMVNGGHYIREAMVHFTKALLLPAGTGLETPSKQQVELMRRFGVTVLLGFADYLKRLAEVCREMGLEPGRDIPVRMISGHLGSDGRHALAQAWGGAKVYDWYGVGDTGVIAAEGPSQNGLYIWEDAHILEILDRDAGTPAAPGADGDICLTVLFKTTVYPVIRFNTHDVSRLLPPDPASGIGFRRLAGFLGRSDNMVKLRGINVYPTAIGAMLADLPGLAGEYVCRLGRRDGAEELTILVEVAATDLTNDGPLRRRVEASLRQKIGVSVAVELVAPGATARHTEIENRQKPIRLIRQQEEQP